jgi:hypothetical protein
MRCRVQKYDPVPGIEGSQDSSAFDDREPAEVHGLLMRSVCAPMNDGESSREISNRQPTVRFHEPDDFGRCDSVSQELADNSNVDERPADSSASSDFDNVDSTATVRPTANRRASTLQGTIAKQGRLFAQRYQNRLVFKDGTCNIVTKNILERKRRYLVDIFTTFVDMKWRYNLLLFGLAFVGSWFTFALVSIISYAGLAAYRSGCL